MSQAQKIKIPKKSLDKLSHGQLVELTNEILQLKEAAKSKTIDRYLQNMHAGQERFHRDEARIRIVTSPNRFGKSTAGIVELIWGSTGTHPFRKNRVPIKSAIVLQDFESHGKNVLESKFKEWAPAGSYNKIERHQGGCLKKIHWTCGSVTDVYSADQEIKVFEGSDYDLIWFDEPPPKAIWTALWRSCVDRGGRMYLTGTPLASLWLYEDFMKWKGNILPLYSFIQFGEADNYKNLGEGDADLGRKRYEEFLSTLDPEEREARGKGTFLQLQGLIFKNWDRGVHLVDEFEVPANWEIWESIDPHPNKPWAVSWIAIAPNGAKILIQSGYFEGVVDEIATQIVEARDLLPKQEGIRLKIARCIIDNSSSVPLWTRSHQDPTARRVSVREELQAMIGPNGAGGPVIEVAPKNVQGKIDILRNWLHPKERNGRFRPEFFVFDGQRNEGFIKEIESYRWDSSRTKHGTELKGKPVKKNDDILDSVMQVALTLKQGEVAEYKVTDMIGGLGTYGGGDNARGSRAFRSRQNSFIFGD